MLGVGSRRKVAKSHPNKASRCWRGPGHQKKSDPLDELPEIVCARNEIECEKAAWHSISFDIFVPFADFDQASLLRQLYQQRISHHVDVHTKEKYTNAYPSLRRSIVQSRAGAKMCEVAA